MPASTFRQSSSEYLWTAGGEAHKRAWPRIGLSRRSILPLLLLALVVTAAGCGPPLPPSKPLAELNAQESSGYNVFQKACSSCHYANNEHSLRGPGLQGLYKKQYLPSGAPANDDRIRAAIEHGRGTMPGFADKLDDQQLQDLMAYLHTL